MTARFAFSHPSRQRLFAWLDGTEDGRSVSDHVDRCNKCATRIEELVGDAGRDALDDQIGNALRDAYAPPDGIEQRVFDQIEQRKRAERELHVLLGIFSIPKDAAELLQPPDTTEPTRRDLSDDREA